MAGLTEATRAERRKADLNIFLTDWYKSDGIKQVQRLMYERLEKEGEKERRRQKMVDPTMIGSGGFT